MRYVIATGWSIGSLAQEVERLMKDDPTFEPVGGIVIHNNVTYSTYTPPGQYINGAYVNPPPQQQVNSQTTQYYQVLYSGARCKTCEKIISLTD